MELISDMLLAAGAFGAGIYCLVLARRLRRFTDLDKGIGGAVSVLAAQVEELVRSLESARAASGESDERLRELTERAERTARRLELIMASMHDCDPAPPAAAERTAAKSATKPAAKPATRPAATTQQGPIFVRHARRREEISA